MKQKDNKVYLKLLNINFKIFNCFIAFLYICIFSCFVTHYNPQIENLSRIEFISYHAAFFSLIIPLIYFIILINKRLSVNNFINKKIKYFLSILISSIFSLNIFILNVYFLCFYFDKNIIFNEYNEKSNLNYHDIFLHLFPTLITGQLSLIIPYYLSIFQYAFIWGYSLVYTLILFNIKRNTGVFPYNFMNKISQDLLKYLLFLIPLIISIINYFLNKLIIKLQNMLKY